MNKFIFDLQRFDDGNTSTWIQFKNGFVSETTVTITLSSDITAERENGIPPAPSSTGNVTIDLNGHTLDLDGGCLYVGAGSLTIKDSTTTTGTPKTGNGKIVSSAVGQSGLIQVTTGALTVESGTIDYAGKSNDSSGAIYCDNAIYGDNVNGTITINGGVIINRNGYGILSQNGVGVTISDGTIIGLGKSVDNVAYTALLGGHSTTDKFIVKGGSFSSNPVTNDNGVKFDDNTKTAQQNSTNNGYWDVTNHASTFGYPDLDSSGGGGGSSDDNAVCKIGDQTYTTLAAAIQAVQESGETSTEIKLLKDITFDSDLSIANKNITLDLSGHTLNTDQYDISIGGNDSSKTTNVTITDSSDSKTGKIVGGADNDVKNYLFSVQTGTLTIEGGTIDRGSKTRLFNVTTQDNYKGYVAIKGGKFSDDISQLTGYGDYITVDGGLSLVKNGNYYEVSSGSFEFSNGTATYKAGSTTLFTVTGLKSSATSADLSLDTTNKKITVKNSALDTTKTVEITGEYTLKLANDVSAPQSTGTPSWKVENGEAKYFAAGKTAGYELSSDGKKIEHKDATDGENLFTITGLKNSATSADLSLDTTNKKITVGSSVLDGKNISITGDEYKLALGTGAPTSTENFDWSVNNGTAEYKKSTTAGYALSADQKSIIYSTETEGETVFTITGLKDSATKEDLSLFGDTVTVKSSALDGKNITISDGYSLALASGAESSTAQNTDWKFANEVAKYETISTTTTYKVSSDAKSINFSETSSENIFVTVEGVNSANGLEFNQTTKILQIPQTSAKNSTVTVNGKNFEPESDLQISAPDKNSATLISGKISVETSFTDADSKTVRVTGGKVTVEVANKNITSITGLDDGEQVTFDGTTYKKVDGALIIGDKIYQNVASDANILSNFSDAGVYAKFVNNFDVESAKQKITGDVKKIYLGSANGYDATYFAILTLDGDKIILQKNSAGKEISNPTLKIDNAAELEIDFASTITAKDAGSYKVSGGEVQISDANGYNILTDAQGKITGLEKISGGATITNAKNLNLKTDSTGKFNFKNDEVSTKGDREVDFVTDENSNLVAVNNLQSGDFFTKLNSISLNDQEISIQGDDDGVTLRADAAGNLSSIGGVANGATILGAGDASINLQNNNSLTIDGKNYSLTDDKDGVIISGGKIYGLDNDSKLVVGSSGNYFVNGEEISANSGDTITTDRAGTPYLYNPDDETILESVTSDENNVVASPTETTDLTGKNGAVIVATNGAKVTNYDVNSFMTFMLGDIANVLQAIRNQTLTFNDSQINFFGNSINFSSVDENTDSFAANISNKNLTETRQVGWSSNGGGSVNEGESRSTKVLVGNYSTGKNSAVLQGGRGNDYIFAGSGDTINSGWGNNSIELNHNTKSTEGAKISVSENSGVDKVSGFTDGYADNSDKLSVSSTENLKVKFRDGKLQVRNGYRKMVFDNVNKNSTLLATSADGEIFVHNLTDSGDVVRLLVDAENISSDANGEVESLRYAVAGENSTIRVENWYDAADYYIGSGKTSALDFEQYNSEVEVNLQSGENCKDIGIVAGGFKNHTLIGSAARETLIAGTGAGSVWGAGGCDLLSGYDGEEKEWGSTFYFMQGDGKDTITNFEAFDEYWTHSADTLSSYGQEITGAYLLGDDVEFRVGNGQDLVRITDAKNKLLLVDNGELHGVRVGDSLAYDDFTTDFIGQGNSTITISDYATGDINIWLDGSDGKFYNGVKVLDASNAKTFSSLVGANGNEKIIAGEWNSSLWGGFGGNDTLIGGAENDEFFYSFGNGNDIISNATENDVVNIFNTDLSQITKVSATSSQIKISFSDYGSLIVNSAENVGFKYQDKIYQLDRQNNSWSEK